MNATMVEAPPELNEAVTWDVRGLRLIYPRLLTTFGADRIMFSVDYPYHRNVQGQFLLDALPVSHADRDKIAHGNADRVLKLKPAK